VGTPRGLDRLIFFTDAVTAIAITLLVLPLVDLVPDAGAAGDAGDFLGAIVPELVSFLISFVVIARLWIAHHAVFEHVKAYSNALVRLSLFWALTIVVLPLFTAMTAEFSKQRLVVGLYIGTMTLSSASLTAMCILVNRSAALEVESYPLSRHAVFGSAATTSSFIVALLIGVLVTAVGYYSLLVLLLADPVGAVIERRTAPTRR
jgi:uncharacterized membrane protein